MLFRSINALREGNLGKALYHLIYEAGGDVGGGLNPALHGTPSPLRALAEALFNVTERTDDRSAIIKTEQSRAAKELGITPDHPSYDKVMQNIADLINNDYDLSKYDFTDADGNLTAAGRLAKDFKPQYERLVPLPKSVKFERSTGRFVDLNGKTINKNAFGNADVFVEGSTKDKDALATLKRIKSEGKVAEYHPETNTFYFTKDGLNDRAILHEMTHAATVKTLHEFANNPDNLARTQREGAQTINDIYNNSKTRLGKQFPHAYDNVYEFVSHEIGRAHV